MPRLGRASSFDKGGEARFQNLCQARDTMTTKVQRAAKIKAGRKNTGRKKHWTLARATTLAAKLPDMFSEGQSITEVCVELKIARQTFYEMRDDYIIFADAVELGLQQSEAWWTRLGREGSSCAHPIQPQTWIFNMKNRFKWVDRSELTGGDGKDLFMAFTQAMGKVHEDEEAR